MRRVHAALPEVAVQRGVVAIAVEEFAAVRAGRHRAGPGGTAESSQPGQVGRRPGTRAVAPSPDSRIPHTRGASSSLSVRASSKLSARCCAASSACFAVSAPTSAISHPPPAGSRSHPSRCKPRVRTSSISTPSKPSSPMGRCFITAGTASAAAGPSANPSTTVRRTAGCGRASPVPAAPGRRCLRSRRRTGPAARGGRDRQDGAARLPGRLGAWEYRW